MNLEIGEYQPYKGGADNLQTAFQNYIQNNAIMATQLVHIIYIPV
jgi:hypothetical protein